MSALHYDSRYHRLLVFNQRVHHGPPGIVVGILLLLISRWSGLQWLGWVLLGWGLSDWHDVRRWFVRGPQL